eukprot:COSAG02_NODE_27564_length_606_cov_8.329389_1_plen_59_part_10
MALRPALLLPPLMLMLLVVVVRSVSSGMVQAVDADGGGIVVLPNPESVLTTMARVDSYF